MRRPLRRTTRLRAGSKTAPTHREVLAPDERREFVARLKAAYGWRCAVCQKARPLEPHHVQKRAQLGPDGWENEVPVCHACHQDTDRPFELTRLVIEHLEGRRFRWARITKASKWAADPELTWTEIAPTEI